MSATPVTDLKRFLAPASIALVGASEDMSRFGGRCLKRIIEFGFDGKLYPVNPSYQTLRGLPCFANIAALPETPDHVGIVVPATKVMGVLEECAARGVRDVTLFSGGFAETATPEGREAQAALRSFARASGMRIMGPNCNGFVNFVDGLAMTSSGSVVGTRRAPGNIGIVSQSGGLGLVNVMWRALELGLGVSYEVSCGNCADLDAFDFAEFLVDDPGTDVILMIMEHFSDGERFAHVARKAAQREKPIVMLKLGRSDAGVRAVASHSGALTGADHAFDAAFRQYGVLRVDDCNDLYQVAMLLRSRRWPRGTRAAATTISGGNGALIVDLGARLGIRFPEYSDDTKARLVRSLPKMGTTTNPTDVTPDAIGRKGVYRECIAAIADDENVDVVIPMLTLAAAADAREVALAVKEARKPVAVLWTGGCVNDRNFTDRDLIAEGVPVYRDTSTCLNAVRAAMRYGEFLARFRRQSGSESRRPAGIDRELARRLVREASGPLTERASKRVLAAYGIAHAVEGLARSADDAVRLWQVAGGPVALKIESPDIPHKTEAGAVRLAVDDETTVRLAFDEIMTRSARYAPTARLDGVLVQPMAPAGLEMIVGTVEDAVFGPLVMAGLGGVHVEILRDVAYRVAPVDVEEAREMLLELKSASALDGVRGMPPRDIAALCDVISRVSWLAYDLRDMVAEIDVNPLIALQRGGGAVVVDALVVPSAAIDVPSSEGRSHCERSNIRGG